MRKSYILYPAVALALVVAASATAIAQRPGSPGRGDRSGIENADRQHPMGGGPGRFGAQGPMFGGITRNLDLTTEQLTKVQAIVDGVRVKVGPLAEELRAARRALRSEVFADMKDQAKIAGLSSEVQALDKQIADIRLETSSAISGVLTPEQREKVRTVTGHKAGARGGPGGAVPGRGPGRGAGRGPDRSPGSVRG